MQDSLFLWRKARFISLTGTVTYDDGTKEDVTGFLASGYDATKTGKQTITLSYGEAKANIDVSVANVCIN